MSKLGMNGKQAGSTTHCEQNVEYTFIEVISSCLLKRKRSSFGMKEISDEAVADWVAASI